jgi:hypothetical protein
MPKRDGSGSAGEIEFDVVPRVGIEGLVSIRDGRRAPALFATVKL